jgi:AAA domain
VDQMIADAIRESRRDLDAEAHAQYVADALNTINLSQGGEREAKSDDKAPPKSDPRLLTLVWDGERELVFPTRLVQDLITENSIGLLAGESQVGKTFLAVDLTFALAIGQTFFGKEVKRGGVLYLAAEAPGTMPARMQAARMHRAYPLVRPGGLALAQADRLPILTIEAVPDLASREGLNQLLFTAEHAARLVEDQYGVPLRLVVIDTNIVAFAIDDWNNPAKVSLVTRAMSRIAQASGAAVMGIAHHGKDISKGVAGSFAQKANVDFILSALMTSGDDGLSGEVKARHLVLTKWRDGPTGWQREYKLVPVKLGEDADGRAAFSAYVEPVEGGGIRIASLRKDKVGRPNASGQIALRALNEAIAECGEPAPPSNHIPKDVRVTTIECWRKYAYQMGISDGQTERARQDAFKRAKDGLLAKQLICVWGEYVWAVAKP